MKAVSKIYRGLFFLSLGLLSGFIIVSPASAENFAGGVFIELICDIFQLTEGHFGAYLMIVSMVGLLIAAAFGSLKGTGGVLMTGIGAFTLSAGVSVYFGEFQCHLVGLEGGPIVEPPRVDGGSPFSPRRVLSEGESFPTAREEMLKGFGNLEEAEEPLVAAAPSSEEPLFQENSDEVGSGDDPFDRLN